MFLSDSCGYEYIFENILEIEKRIDSFLCLESLVNPKLTKLATKIRKLGKEIPQLEGALKEQAVKKLAPIKYKKRELEAHLKKLKENTYSIETLLQFKSKSSK